MFSKDRMVKSQDCVLELKESDKSNHLVWIISVILLDIVCLFLLFHPFRIKYLSLNPCPTSLGFYVSSIEVFLKTLWENEKLLGASNFCFSHIGFYLFGELSAIISKFEIVICKLFKFGSV